ncbi:MAG: glycosyltransferase family 39 protein [Agarilytica sp.]
MLPIRIDGGRGLETIERLLLSTPALLLLSFVSVIGMSFAMPLFDLDEGAFSEASREMVASGNWVSTYLNGEPRHDKPILIYWLQATSLSLFGNHPFTFRLPSLIVAFAWIYIFFLFAKEIYNDRAARIGVWVLTCCWLSTTMFKAATADTLLNFLIIFTFFEIYRYVCLPSNKKLLLIGVLLGLGFLTKGPIAIGLPALTCMISLMLTGQTALFFRTIIHPFLWGTFLIIVVPWHIASYYDQGTAFFEGFYLGHNVGRFSSTMENHGGTPFYYLALLPFMLLPHTRLAIQALFKYKLDRKNFPQMYLLVWFLLTLTIFSFSKTQLPHYLLYGMTPVFLLLTYQLSLLKETSLRKTDIGIALFALVFFCLLPYLFAPAVEHVKNPYDKATAALGAELFSNDYFWLPACLMLFGLATLFLVQLSALSRLLCTSLVIMLSMNFMLGPIAAGAQQGPVAEAAAFIKNREITETKRNLVAYRIYMPSVSVYAERIVPNQHPQPGDIVFTKISATKKLAALNPEIEIEELFRRGGIALYLYGNETHSGNVPARQQDNN